MRTEHLFPQEHRGLGQFTVRPIEQKGHPLALFARQAPIGVLLVIALLAFEVFNFDTTRFALLNLMGDISFVGLRWASILALAFCAIDFAGLAHLFAPGRDGAISGETWYLMGAWILGATMNAVMTWWAVSLTLLSHQLGNEILSREQLLEIVPPFVAALVWITRILFIGAFSVTGSQFLQSLEAGGDDSRSLDDDESSFTPDVIYTDHPLRDSTQATPMPRNGGFQPIPRAPRPAVREFSARSRRRSSL